jgi:hypothetical protein
MRNAPLSMWSNRWLSMPPPQELAAAITTAPGFQMRRHFFGHEPTSFNTRNRDRQKITARWFFLRPASGVPHHFSGSIASPTPWISGGDMKPILH